MPASKFRERHQRHRHAADGDLQRPLQRSAPAPALQEHHLCRRPHRASRHRAERGREADRRAVQGQGQADPAQLSKRSTWAASYARRELAGAINLNVRRADAVGDRIFIEGNDAAGLGAVYGGATVAAWYPITPSTSLAEAFGKHCRRYRVDQATGKNRYAIVQAEDELASIGMVIGAAWNGARAFTATAGPGISLMQEFIGLAYFAEIPAVIFDVQRGGPSTGMPTRTQQSDMLICAYASHGDTKHVLLFPEDPRECFEFAAPLLRSRRPAADADLRHARPRHRHERVAVQAARLGRQPRLRPRQGAARRRSSRRAASSGAISTSTATASPTAPIRARTRASGAFFTRGTSKNRYARYSEEGADYVDNMQRLLRKFETAKGLVPAPDPHRRGGADALRRDLLRLDRAGDAGGARGARRRRHPSRHASRARLPLRRHGGRLRPRRTTSSSWSSRTATRSCGRCSSTSARSTRHASSVLHYDGTPITARFIIDAVAANGERSPARAGTRGISKACRRLKRRCCDLIQ